jgi:ectoine hydroxylase-related dioxygenase (phytanoyl-CoA dioxygenase family)
MPTMAQQTQDQVQQVHESGYCILTDVIPADVVDSVCGDVLAVDPALNRPDAPANRGAISGLINHTQSFAPYLADPRILDLTSALLGEHVRISYTSTIVSYPGATRLQWHADWPFNQGNAGHMAAPYPDVLAHLTSIWMLNDFTIDNGATLIVPRSHRQSTNPTGNNGVDKMAPHPEEIHITGRAGTVMVMDSRVWHATPTNNSGSARVGLAIRWAPWWLNLDVLMPGSDERHRMVEEVTGAKDNQVPAVESEVWAALPSNVQPLFRHWTRGRGNWPA